MKKVVILLLVVLALVLIVSVVSAAPGKGSASDLTDFCKAVAAASDYSVGQCMSYFRYDLSSNEAVAVCKIFYPLVGFESLGECVSFVHGL